MSGSTEIVGSENRNTIKRNCCQRSAPSKIAASIRSLGIVCRAAKREIAIKGVVFQTIIVTIVGQTVWSSPVKEIGSEMKPKFNSNWLIGPPVGSIIQSHAITETTGSGAHGIERNNLDSVESLIKANIFELSKTAKSKPINILTKTDTAVSHKTVLNATPNKSWLVKNSK